MRSERWKGVPDCASRSGGRGGRGAQGRGMWARKGISIETWNEQEEAARRRCCVGVVVKRGQRNAGRGQVVVGEMFGRAWFRWLAKRKLR